MNCNQAQRLMSFEPRGAPVPSSPAVRSHLETCPACRAFWEALLCVDRALAARPLAIPASGFAGEVLLRLRHSPHLPVTPPFSRTFCLFTTLVTLCALVGGAWLLQQWSAASVQGTSGVPALWVRPAWPDDASAWLSLKGGHVAQLVLPVMAGIIVTLVGAAIGFHASERWPHDTHPSQERVLPPHS